MVAVDPVAARRAADQAVRSLLERAPLDEAQTCVFCDAFLGAEGAVHRADCPWETACMAIIALQDAQGEVDSRARTREALRPDPRNAG